MEIEQPQYDEAGHVIEDGKIRLLPSELFDVASHAGGNIAKLAIEKMRQTVIDERSQVIDDLSHYTTKSNLRRRILQSIPKDVENLGPLFLHTPSFKSENGPAPVTYEVPLTEAAAPLLDMYISGASDWVEFAGHSYPPLVGLDVESLKIAEEAVHKAAQLIPYVDPDS